MQGKLAPCGHCKERIKNLLNDESVGENEGGALSVDVTQVKVAKKKKKQPQQHRPRRSESTSPTLSELNTLCWTLVFLLPGSVLCATMKRVVSAQ